MAQDGRRRATQFRSHLRFHHHHHHYHDHDYSELQLQPSLGRLLHLFLHLLPGPPPNCYPYAHLSSSSSSSSSSDGDCYYGDCSCPALGGGGCFPQMMVEDEEEDRVTQNAMKGAPMWRPRGQAWTLCHYQHGHLPQPTGMTFWTMTMTMTIMTLC